MRPVDPEQVLTVAERDIQAVRRNTPLLALGAVVVSVVIGVSRLRGTGYIPLALDLVTVLEFLIPVLAFALGYRALLDDKVRGELDMLRTCPIERSTLVAGVFVGRAILLLLTVLGSLFVAGGIVAVSGGPTSTVLATHSGGDMPLLFLRFVVLSAVYASVALAVALAISAAAGSTRQATGLAAGLFVGLVIGFDLGLIGGLVGGVIPESTLNWLVAVSPNSAYRGLVFETVVRPVSTGQVQTANPLASALGLATWLFGSLAVAIRTIWST